MWDVSTETGEIACAVLVPSTKTADFSHAAQQLCRRGSFHPKAMYSDTWPCKADYWSRVLGKNIEGRLGLFHFIQRIMRTLRKKHVDYFRAINGLLHAVYFYNAQDYERLLAALRAGTVGGTKYNDDDISYMKSTKTFRQRYDKYLRKEIRSPLVMRSMLDDWFDTYKCSSSGTVRPALGRRDPMTQQTLFTEDTRNAWENCKEKVEYLQDPLPLEEMYFVIKPHPSSPHGLNEYLSRRGESSLESFHLLLAHFANCGMRNSLADNLNLTGTARFNITIRHKMRLVQLPTDRVVDRKKMPAAWETVVPYFNHLELQYVNRMAEQAGLSKQQVPFHNVESIVEDTGERFFSEYLEWLNEAKPAFDIMDRCLCDECGVSSTTSNAIALPLHSPNLGRLHGLSTNNHDDIAVAAPPPPRVILPAPPQQPAIVARQPPPTVIAMPIHHHGFHQQPFASPWMFPQVTYCCERYRVWYNQLRRRGRPPHEIGCPFHNRRASEKQNQIQTLQA
jgi:hypothetical protein